MFGLFKICQAESNVDGAQPVTVDTKGDDHEEYQPAYIGAEIKDGAPLPLLGELRERPYEASIPDHCHSQVRAPGSPRKLYGDGSPIRGHSPRALQEPESPKVMVGSPRAQRDVVTDATIGDLQLDRQIEIKPYNPLSAERREVRREIVHHHIFDAERRMNRGDDLDERVYMEPGGWNDELHYTHGLPDDQPFTTIGGRKGNFEGKVNRWD